METQILSPIYFRIKFVKRWYTSCEVHFQSKLDTLNYKEIFGRAPNNGGWPSAPLQYSVVVCTVLLKKLWVEHWFKFSSGNCNVCEAISSFIKSLMLNKNPSYLRFKHKHIASIEITHTAKSFMTGENLFASTVV